MNQSELIEKVAQASELNQAAAGRAVKAVVNAILDALVAGDAVRVSGLGIFNVAARPARQGRNPQTGEAIQIAASKAVQFHAGKAVKKMPSIRRLPRGPRGRRLHHQRNPRCGSKRPIDLRERWDRANTIAIPRGASSGTVFLRRLAIPSDAPSCCGNRSGATHLTEVSLAAAGERGGGKSAPQRAGSDRSSPAVAKARITELPVNR